MSPEVLGLIVAELGAVIGLLYWLLARIASAHNKIAEHKEDTATKFMAMKNDIHEGNAEILNALQVAMSDKMTEPQIQNYVIRPFKDDLKAIVHAQEAMQKSINEMNSRLSKLQGMDERAKKNAG